MIVLEFIHTLKVAETDIVRWCRNALIEMDNLNKKLVARAVKAQGAAKGELIDLLLDTNPSAAAVFFQHVRLNG
jgi:hypothetical protein